MARKATPKSFTAMSDEAIAATIAANEATGEHYALTLNPSDFAMLMRALQAAYDFGDHEGVSVSEWAASYASGIAGTLKIEMI